MDAAAQMLARAVELDQSEKYKEALVCYQEGLDLLFKCSQSLTEKIDRERVREKLKTYMDRAEKVKTMVQEQKGAGDLHKKIEIKNGSTGFSYRTIFSGLITDSLTHVTISDAYIRSPHQMYNLVRFCELLVKNSKSLQEIKLITKRDEKSDVQEDGLSELQSSLQNHDIRFMYEYSETLHDREITLSNGWVIKIGRGLDYFKAPCGRFTIGHSDFDLRPCHETVIDIYKQN